MTRDMENMKRTLEKYGYKCGPLGKVALFISVVVNAETLQVK